MKKRNAGTIVYGVLHRLRDRHCVTQKDKHGWTNKAKNLKERLTNMEFRQLHKEGLN